MPASESESMQGRRPKTAELPGFRCLPVHLQSLTDVRTGFQPAVTGIGNIEAQAATAVLTDLLDHKTIRLCCWPRIARRRLPDTRFQGHRRAAAVRCFQGSSPTACHRYLELALPNPSRAQAIKLISREKADDQIGEVMSNVSALARVARRHRRHGTIAGRTGTAPETGR